jgi:hypothetical protein
LILEHEGGHVVASTPEIRARFRGFLEAMLERKLLASALANTVRRIT